MVRILSKPKYVYEHKDWPAFRWDDARLAGKLAEVRHRQGRLIGKMEGLGFALQSEAVLQTLTEDTIKTSEIEGEQLDRTQVRSSLARHLGLDAGGLKSTDRRVDGIVEMMLDATQKFHQPLTHDRLFAWHSTLFPGGRSGMTKISVGKWRDDSAGRMQVVSGPIGKSHVHYEAPPAKKLNAEMRSFITWVNKSTSVEPVLKAGVAHFWFVTLHPFDDGNGRIARAIADMLLARSENTVQRFYSMSGQICAERKNYYDILEAAQKGDLDITHWLEWFLGCLNRAIEGAEVTLASVLAKAKFWDLHREEQINERQRAMINRLLGDFEGKLTSSKWATFCKCSQDTASRDIEDLIGRGILKKNQGGGRSTSYSLVK